MSAVGTLVRAHLRRDRWALPAWWVAGTLLYCTQAVSIDGLYATQAELDQAAAAMEGNAAFVAMAGPARALDTVGGQVAWQSTAYGVVLAGLMSTMLVVRHTRGEEESGRDELVRAAAVPRRAPLVAAMVVATLANVVLGVLVAASLASYGLALADSAALGVGLALAGLLLATVALLAAQVFSTGRAVWGATGAVIGAAFALRAVGDVAENGLSWLSPIGWYQAMHAFSGLRWWPAALLVLAAVPVAAGAVAAFERRDIGSGLRAASPGPARGGRSLSGPLGLTWRLQRPAVVGWTLGLLLTGLAYGTIGDSARELIGESSQALFGGGDDLVAGYYGTTAVMLALIAGGFTVSSALRAKGEEESGRGELLLAQPLARGRWLGAHVAATVAGSVAVVVAAWLGVFVGYAVVTGEAGDAAHYAAPTLVQVVPLLVLAGVAALGHALGGRASALGWAVLAWSVVVLLFGEAWRVPGWAQGLSPYDHLPLAPAEAYAWGPVVGLLVVAALAWAASYVVLCRRDLG